VAGKISSPASVQINTSSMQIRFIFTQVASTERARQEIREMVKQPGLFESEKDKLVEQVFKTLQESHTICVR